MKCLLMGEPLANRLSSLSVFPPVNSSLFNEMLYRPVTDCACMFPAGDVLAVSSSTTVVYHVALIVIAKPRTSCFAKTCRQIVSCWCDEADLTSKAIHIF